MLFVWVPVSKLSQLLSPDHAQSLRLITNTVVSKPLSKVTWEISSVMEYADCCTAFFKGGETALAVFSDAILIKITSAPHD